MKNACVIRILLLKEMKFLTLDHFLCLSCNFKCICKVVNGEHVSVDRSIFESNLGSIYAAEICVKYNCPITCIHVLLKAFFGCCGALEFVKTSLI